MIGFFHKIADSLFYLPLGGEVSFRRKCADFIDVAPGDSVLDICCGSGNLIAFIANQHVAANFTGVDISEIQIKKAREKNPDATLRVASAASLPFESSTFDNCIISFGLHHVEERTRLEALKEAHRVLVPGGSLYIFDYNIPEKGLGRFAATIMTKLDNKGSAFQMLYGNKLMRDIEKTGFSILRQAFMYLGAVQLLKICKKPG